MRKVVGFSIPAMKFIIFEKGFTLLLISTKVYYQLYTVIQAVLIFLRQTTLVILDFYDFYAQILLHKSHQKMNRIHMYM